MQVMSNPREMSLHALTNNNIKELGSLLKIIQKCIFARECLFQKQKGVSFHWSHGKQRLGKLEGFVLSHS